MLQQPASFPAWLQHDMEQVNALIRRQFDSEVVLIRQVVEFILHGGERLRPALVLAAARALGHSGDRQYALAAAVELIHISLALHDGVTEASGGGADAHSDGALFGNAANSAATEAAANIFKRQSFVAMPTSPYRTASSTTLT